MASTAIMDPSDSEFSDNDSLYNSDFASGSTSLNSEVQDYVYELGRRYHGYKDGKCPLPNDEVEQDRLDMMHELWMQVLGGKLHLAPIVEPANILDLGCGTGIWAIETADLFQNAMIYGNDLSPIQPRWVPPNVRFEVDDVEDEWTWGSKKFDFIHSRDMSGSINDWKKYFKSIYNNLKEGGYIEVKDFDYITITTDEESLPATAFVRYRDLLQEASAKYGKPMDTTTQYARMLREAGFTNIVQRTFNVPIGPWPKRTYEKRLGMLFCHILRSGAEAYALKMCTSALGMDVETINKIVHDYVAEISDKRVHASCTVYVVYARKPETSKAQAVSAPERKKRKKEDTPEDIPQLAAVPEGEEIATTTTNNRKSSQEPTTQSERTKEHREEGSTRSEPTRSVQEVNPRERSVEPSGGRRGGSVEPTTSGRNTPSRSLTGDK